MAFHLLPIFILFTTFFSGNGGSISKCWKPCICVDDILKCEWLGLEQIPFMPPTQVGKIKTAILRRNRMSWPRLELFPNLMFADLRNNTGLNCSAVIILERARPEITVLSSCQIQQTTIHTTLLDKLSTRLGTDRVVSTTILPLQSSTIPTTSTTTTTTTRKTTTTNIPTFPKQDYEDYDLESTTTWSTNLTDKSSTVNSRDMTTSPPHSDSIKLPITFMTEFIASTCVTAVILFTLLVLCVKF